MKLNFVVVALASLLITLSPSSFAADAENGRKLYGQCIQCHGESGRGNLAEEAPSIAGQHDWYIITSINQFKAGSERKNPKMLPFIKNLSDADIADLAAYVSQMK